MVFSYDMYLLNGVVIPCLVALFLFVFAIGVCCWFCYMQKIIWIKVSPFVVLLGLYILIIGIMFPLLPYVEHLPSEKEMTAQTDVIQIQEITDTLNIPIISNYNFGLLKSRFLISDKGVYYCHSAANLKIGDYVWISYLPYSKAILEWNHITEQETLQHPIIHTTPSKPAARYSESGYESRILGSVIVLVFLKSLLVSCFADKIIYHLEQNDTLDQGFIKPRLFGLINKGMNEIVFITSSAISFISNSLLLGGVLAVVSLGYGYIMIETLTTRFHYNTKTVHFKSLSTHLDFLTSDIQSVSWEHQRRVFGYVLTISLRNKKIFRFPQVDFIGLKKFVENHKTGDGSLS